MNEFESMKVCDKRNMQMVDRCGMNFFKNEDCSIIIEFLRICVLF